VISELKTTVH